jgi:hypothetical protein
MTPADSITFNPEYRGYGDFVPNTGIQLCLPIPGRFCLPLDGILECLFKPTLQTRFLPYLEMPLTNIPGWSFENSVLSASYAERGDFAVGRTSQAGYNPVHD